MTQKFTIRSCNLVCSSVYKCMNTDCVICKNNLSENSVAEEHLLSSNVNIGACGHGFHSICINDWIKNIRTCPICCQNWISN